MVAGVSDTEAKIKKSKSQIKREFLALQELGKKLVALPEKSLQRIPITEDVRDAVLEAKRFRREALRRQYQHIGALLRNEDEDAIRNALATVLQPHEKDVRAFHEAEQWREELLAGDDDLLDSLCSRFTQADRKHLKRLVQDAIREQERNKPPKSAKALFRYLTGLQRDQ
jgi:ribosome-associated protein